MNRKTASLVGAISVLATAGVLNSAQAKEVVEVLTPTTYAELLQPIPNAVALLGAANALSEGQASESGPGNVQLAQYHHHHHHHQWRRHHHHHHNWRHHHHHHPHY